MLGDEQRNFRDLYIANDVGHKIGDKVISIGAVTLKNVTAKSRFVILKGAGGIGKSMMMKYLLLNAVDDYAETGVVPVFVSLKDFKPNMENVFELVCGAAKNFAPNLAEENIKTALDRGLCLLLFDGFDEIAKAEVERFEREMEKFTDQYSMNIFIVSSRPFKSFVRLERFDSLELQPFDKEQALRLVENLKYRPETDTTKRFYRELDRRLYDSHKSFVSNPLLLTITLRTFATYGRVSTLTYMLYQQAFLVLAQEHDASKGVERKLLSAKNAEDFSEIFAELCYWAYKDNKFELKREEFEYYYKKLKSPKIFASADDFIHDVCFSVCVMYGEEGCLRFFHRSFQEYFAAVYLNKVFSEFPAKDNDKKKKYSKTLAELFEERCSTKDQTLDMLCEMNLPKVEEFIFAPFLEGIFDLCDPTNGGQGIFTFLSHIYDGFYICVGEVPEMEQSDNEPISYLYREILCHVSFVYKTDCNKGLPLDKTLTAESEYVYHYDELIPKEDAIGVAEIWFEDEVIEYDEIGEEDLEVVGRTFYINLTDIAESPEAVEKHKILLDALNDDGFIYKAEYNVMREYVAKIRARQEVDDDDLV